VAGLAAVEDQRLVQDFALEQASLVHCDLGSASLRVLMIRRLRLHTGRRELAGPRSLRANMIA
jgi:hypothetical protein